MSIRDIPWRGPRPLTQDDKLHGRSRELRELSDRCKTYDIIELTAPSGVGKTSFVSAGGKPELEDAGYFVPAIVRWSELLGHPALQGVTDAEEYAAVVYRLILGMGEDELAPDGRTTAELADAVADGRRMVVVLDQMDELLRYKRAVGNALLALAGRAARDSSVPHIVIARTEFRERLSPVEARGAQVWNLYLDEITSEKALKRIITGPASKAGVEIADDAADRIFRWWAEAKADAGRQIDQGASVGDVGLLHLQALLVSFKRWAVEHGRGDAEAVDAAMLKDFATTAGIEDVGRGARLIERAIVGHVEETVLAATAAPAVAYRDQPVRTLDWANGPKLALSRIAPVLSSGGYKVPQTMASLIPVALGEELSYRNARAIGDAIRAGRSLEECATIAEGRVQGEGIAVAHGWSTERILQEALDALASIVQALSTEEANVLRAYNVIDEPVYELVHDGIGVALDRWASSFRDRPIAEIARIMAKSGGAMMHDLTVETFSAAEDEGHWGLAAVEGDHATLRHVVWNAYYIGPSPGRSHLRLEGLVFRDCEFRGAAFIGCDLRNVSFVNCRLAGAVFIDCSLDGVRFEKSGLDQVTFKACRASDVAFDVLEEVTGLVLKACAGGCWHFRYSAVHHLVVDAVEGPKPLELLLERCSLRHATLTGPVDFREDESGIAYAEVAVRPSSSESVS